MSRFADSEPQQLHVAKPQFARFLQRFSTDFVAKARLAGLAAKRNYQPRIRIRNSLKPATDAGFTLLDIKASALDIRAILVNDNLNSEGRREDNRILQTGGQEYPAHGRWQAPCRPDRRYAVSIQSLARRCQP